MPEHILLVDSSKPSAESLSHSLTDKGYSVAIARSAKSAFRQVRAIPPDLIVIDVTSARLDGKRICGILYQRTYAPILAVTPPKVETMEGANDCLPKPVTARKLLVRVKKLLKEKAPRVMQAGDLSLDLKARAVSRGSQKRKLTPKECRLLQVLMSHPNEVVTRKTLMKTVWDTDYMGDTRTLDVHVRWVREKIEDNPSKPKLLKTARGQGYRLVVPT